ncbi:hypothetical protein AAG906_017988 [Vitis piasezkii]
MYLQESFLTILVEHEINLIDYDEVWKLVETPEGIEPIGCKWVYMGKKGIDGKVEMYKARLIIKGYSQKPSLDYKKAFSLVTILKSITMLLSIMAHLDFET